MEAVRSSEAGHSPTAKEALETIDELRRADEARRMAEFRFQRLIEYSPLSTQLFWPDGRTRQINAAFTRLFGITFEQLKDYNILQDEQLVHLGVMPLMRRAFAGEAVVIEPIPYQPQFGQYIGQTRWAGAHVYPVKDDAGHIEEVVLVHLDVTEQRVAEDALRQSESRLRSLIEQSAAGIAQTDLSGRITLANDRYCQIVGYPMPEVIGKRVHDLTHPEDLATTTRVVADGAASGQEYALEKRYLRKDGSVVWIAVSASIVKDAAGKPQSIMGVVIDISDRKRIEAALRESEERLRLGLQAGKTGTWDWDIPGNTVAWSEQLYAFHGLKPGEFGGRVEDFAKIVHPEDAARVQQAIEQAIANRTPYIAEFRTIHPDGTVRWLATHGEVRYGDDGRPMRMLGATTDVTERKRAEEEREQLLVSERAARAEAERQGRLKDEFLATLSHELRTPLNAIFGWSQLLRTKPAVRHDEDLAQGIEVIDRNARAQTRIIDDLLEMSRVISGKVRLDVQRVELATILESAVQTVRHAADAKGVRLQVVIDPYAGPVSGDPSRLQQVFWNLLSNSVKHTERGGRIQVLLERVNSHLEVSVIDDGEGIDPAFLPHVFDRFRQADSSTTRRHGGLGLGLSIVKQLVELHGGRVRAKSPGIGKGSTFTVALPLMAVQADPAPPAVATRRDDAAVTAATDRNTDRISLRGLHVLVVDDEPDARLLVKLTLENCEATVTMAASASEAVALLPELRPHVLISDIGMPGEDGYTLIRKVRQLGAAAGGALPAIALTAYARSDDRTRALLAGFQAHVAKPVEPTELVVTVAALVGRHA